MSKLEIILAAALGMGAAAYAVGKIAAVKKKADEGSECVVLGDMDCDGCECQDCCPVYADDGCSSDNCGDVCKDSGNELSEYSKNYAKQLISGKNFAELIKSFVSSMCDDYIKQLTDECSVAFKTGDE